MGFLDEHCLFQELTDEKIAVSKPFIVGITIWMSFSMRM